MTLLDEIAAAFTAEQVNINDLPEADPVVALGQQCSALFTSGVEILRSVIPNERIRTLSRVVWDLVGNKRVLVVLGPRVPSLSFTAMRQGDVVQGLVLIPETWPEMAREDAFMQLGAILYVGVQIVDFHNDRLVDDPTARPRWHAYEAELLHTLTRIIQSQQWTPNQYQRAVMQKYPDGLDSAGVQLYAFKPYEPSKGSA